MRAVELPNWNLVRDQMSEALAWKPGVDVKSRWLHLERWLAELCQVQVDGVVRRRTYRRGNPGEGGQHGTMNVPTRDQPRTRVTPDDPCQFVGIEEVLSVHMPDATLEWWMMQEYQRRSIRRRRQRRVEPLQCGRLERAVRLPGHA